MIPVSVTRVSVTVTCIVVSIILYLVISTCTGSSTSSLSRTSCYTHAVTSIRVRQVFDRT